MNDDYIATLDYLINLKTGKKKPPKIESDNFCAAWVNLAVQEGFSGRTEKYLYDGFGYCGATPLVRFMLQCDNPQKILKDCQDGKMYRVNCGATFRLMTHLFALLLKQKKMWPLVPELIKLYPAASTSKEKKRLGNFESTISNYFFGELGDKIQFPSLTDMPVKPVFITEFTDLIQSALDGISREGIAKKKISAMDKVQTWIDEYKTAGKRIPAEKEGNAADTNQDSVTIPELSKADVTLKKDNIFEADLSLSDLLDQASIAAAEIVKENARQKEKIRLADQTISELQDEVSLMRVRLDSAEKEAAAVRKSMEEKETVILEKQQEAEQKAKLAEVLGRDRVKQTDEALRRIASKLKIEYQDFKDAADIPMSCDLGENFRIQLSNIFDILEKGGMKIK